ncbi:unnamed protein product [Nezara viridula]|uniref:Methyltransferase HEMK2 n=1 Tax=Nezara viridula TaxID=85310 RepID=A0A9P0E2S7_NEZVI|nr:unnamed protein product [Nezara viridula]
MENKEKLDTPLWDLNNYAGGVYEPMEDSFLLLDTLEEELPLIRNLNPAIILEIGSGSGIIISSLAGACQNSFCMAIDINPTACLATENTAKLNGTSVNAIQGDLVNGLKLKNLIDVLVFNPPYVPSEDKAGNELIDKAWAGGVDGRATTNRLFPYLNDLMSEKSVGYLVAISENNPLEMCTILENMGFKADNIKSRRILGEYLSILRFTKGI